MKTSAGLGNICRVLHEKTVPMGRYFLMRFVAVLDGQIQAGTDKAVGDSDSAILPEQDTDILEKMLDRVLEQKFHEMLQKMQKVLAEQMSSSFTEYVSTDHSDAEKYMEKTDADGMGQMQETELSEDMMAFAFGMGE